MSHYNLGFISDEDIVSHVTNTINKFYELVCGDSLAFKKLCEKLPRIIHDTVDHSKKTMIKNTVFEELEDISPHLIQSIYLLSFAKYEGFDTLEIQEA